MRDLSGMISMLYGARKDGRESDLLTRYSIREDKARTQPSGEYHYANTTILLAEDNPVNQEVMTAMLQNKGIKTVVTPNGRLALEEAEAGIYDMIFMDCQMPEMDGFEATRLIRESRTPAKDFPIVALTANAMTGDREKCIAAGMNDYLSKPVKQQELQMVLARWIDPSKRTEAVAVAATPVQDLAISGGAIDAQVLKTLRSVTGDKFDKIVSSYLSNAVKYMENIEIGLNGGDAALVNSVAHTFKSSSGQLGARKVQECMGAIEAAAGNGDLVLASNLFARAKSDLEAARAELEQAMRHAE